MPRTGWRPTRNVKGDILAHCCRFTIYYARATPKAIYLHIVVALQYTTRRATPKTIYLHTIACGFLRRTTYGLNQLFGCAAKQPSKQTHGIRQTFGLHTAFAKPLACPRNKPAASYVGQAYGLNKLFGCAAKQPSKQTHGIRQTFGLHTAYAKPLACAALETK